MQQIYIENEFETLTLLNIPKNKNSFNVINYFQFSLLWGNKIIILNEAFINAKLQYY